MYRTKVVVVAGEGQADLEAAVEGPVNAIDVADMESSDPYWWSLHGLVRRLKVSRYFGIMLGLHVDADLGIEDIDNSMNMFALLNSLTLSIPFGVMTSCTAEQWDYLLEVIKSCPHKPTCGSHLFGDKNFGCAEGPYDPELHIKEMKRQIRWQVFLSIYSAILSIVLCIWYYMCRPSARKEETLTPAQRLRPFIRWWGRGRLIVAGAQLSSILNVIGVLFLGNQYMEVFYLTTAEKCAEVPGTMQQYTAYWLSFVGIILAALYIAI